MLCFPRLETLRQALAGDALPATLWRAPAVAGIDTLERLWIDPTAKLSNSHRSALLHLGVDLDATPDVPLSEQITCWQQLLGVESANGEITLAPNTPVLFELGDFAMWPRFVAEMQRLQGRALDVSWATTDDERLLLRVVDPPFYSLLRARQSGDVRAYIEQAPRVWVEIGCRQPLGEQIQPAANQLLFIRAPRSWTYRDKVKFQAPRTEELVLPDRPAAWTEDAPDRRLPVALRLARGGSIEPAEMWVIRRRALEQLDELLRSADDAFLANLSVAFVRQASEAIVVLRARPRRQQPPPVISLDAEEYRPYLKLANLLLPVGYRLQPAPRRDAVRALFAEDSERVFWLASRADSSFAVESVAETAFVPLSERIDYLSEHAACELQSWFEQHPAEFQAYEIRLGEPAVESVREQMLGKEPAASEITKRSTPRTDAPPTTPPEPEPPAAQPAGLWNSVVNMFRGVSTWLGQNQPPAAPVEAPRPPAPAARRRRAGPPPDPISQAVQQFLQPAPEAQTAPPSPREPTYDELEERFFALNASLDDPERQTLWTQLAGQYQAAGNLADSSICWINALWQSDPPSSLWVRAWSRAEARAANWRSPESEVQRCLAAARSNPADVRAVGAFVADLLVNQSEPLPDSVDLARVRQYLEVNDSALPIRAAWLIWFTLSGQGGGDVLSLARARDRILERLFRHGLSPVRDLPTFLRYAGQTADRVIPIRDWLPTQREPIRQWLERLHADPRRQAEPVTQGDDAAFERLTTERLIGQQPPYILPSGDSHCTPAYADLMFAWGLARVGAEAEAIALFNQTRPQLVTRDGVHQFLLNAFSYRIQQVLENRSLEGPLPQDQLTTLERMTELDRYRINWFRQQSRILEPDERIDPYLVDVQRGTHEELDRQLARLPAILDRQELATRLHDLLGQSERAGPNQATTPRILKAALGLAPRIGEVFAFEMLGHVQAALEGLPDEYQRAQLLERALFVAAHFEQTELVQQFVRLVRRLLETREGNGAQRAFALLAEQSFRGLRKLGMRDEIFQLQRQMASAVLQGETLPQLRDRLGSRFPEALPTLLHIAAGWFYEGDDAQGTAVLDQVRTVLNSNRLAPTEQARLARAYVSSLSQAPVGLAVGRIEELFQSNHLGRVYDRLNTNTHFSLAQLGVIEAVVMSVVDANFALGTTVRRWLDEDEYLVRRRIYRDLRAALNAAGQ